MSFANKISLFMLCLFLFLSCGNEAKRPKLFKKRINYEKLNAFDKKGNLQAVIEIPAGTNHKIEYDKDLKRFITDQREGKDRIIDFLPYPGNYGYIPGTLSDKTKGGDGDAIDVLVIAENQPTGSVMSIKPIATLQLLDEDETDTKIIAIPMDSTLRVIYPADFQDFMIEYDAARRMIEDWFMNYDGYGTNKLDGWKDAKFALKVVESQLIKRVSD